jgi:hypothetical protein
MQELPVAQAIQAINRKIRPGETVVTTHFTRWVRIICDMVPVLLFFSQVMAPVGHLTLPVAGSAAIPGVNMGAFQLRLAGRAELMPLARQQTTSRMKLSPAAATALLDMALRMIIPLHHQCARRQYFR